MNNWKTKRAILFGLNYPNTNNALQGCVEDVKAVKKYLISRCNFTEADVQLCADTDPALAQTCTRAGIIQKLQQLATDSYSRKLDGVYFHYSGHGTSTSDFNGSEVDQDDEAVFCTDSRLLTDDIVGEILRKFNPATQVVLCFDSCHSGSMCDLAFNYDTNGNCTNTHELTCAPRVLSLSGCRDEETSAESFDNGMWRGAMSVALLKALDVPAGTEMSWLQLLGKMSKFLKESSFTQQPQLCTSFALKSNDLVLAKPVITPAPIPAPAPTPTPTPAAVPKGPLHDRVGALRAEARGTKACLSVGGCDKPPLVYLDNNTNVLQKFKFSLVAGKHDVYTIQSQARIQCTSYLGCKSYSVVMLKANNADAQWQAIQVSNDKYRLKNVVSGGYLSVAFGTVSTNRTAGANEVFQLQ